MKKILVLLVTICLCGCQNINKNVNSELDVVFNNQNVIDVRRNNYTEYFDYYAPSDLYEIDSNETFVSFNYNKSLIDMNINIPSIINELYYSNYKLVDEGYFDYSKLIYSKNDKFINNESETIDFFVNLYKLDNMYFFYMKTNNICLYAKTNINDVVEVAKKMMILAKTVKVQKELVVNKYSSKDVIDYEKKVIELFDTKMPENGIINDLIITDSSTN